MVAGCNPNLKAPFFPPFVWAFTLALASKKSSTHCFRSSAAQRLFRKGIQCTLR